MTWVIEEAEVLLQTNHYYTLHLQAPDALAFEDAVILGFLLEYEDVPALLASWSADQTTLLSRFAPALRAVREKAWNVYFVLATTKSAKDDEERFFLETLESDLHLTRKITCVGVSTPADLQASLGAILPVSNRIALFVETFPERLKARLQTEVGLDPTRLFLGEADEAVVAQALLEEAR